MLTIRDITVRLGGRTILDGASATLPQGGKIGLIGRNGAGKSTLVKTIIGELEPDGGAVDMPRRARLGYIAQEAPSGTRTPFEAVLDADTERFGHRFFICALMRYNLQQLHRRHGAKVVHPQNAFRSVDTSRYFFDRDG